MARRTKRRFDVFSLSFLDVMSCGFGAVVLIFLIINHAVDDETKELNRDLLAESRKLDYQIDVGEENLVDLTDTLEDTNRRVDQAKRELLAMIEELERRREDQDELEAETIARIASIEELKTDIETREQDVERLKAQERAAEGNRIREIRGEGDRQYLTGLRVGGRHVLIVLDSSASMLDETIVQVIRRRNMPIERRRAAPKWQRALKTVEWLAAQVPLDSQFQMMTFNSDAEFHIGENGIWIDATEPDAIDEALDSINEVVPENGTNLHSLFTRISTMNPLPDNVFLITDGLPTLGERAPRKATVNGRERRQLFERAYRVLPNQIPMNVIMFPIEGDPMAAAAYWSLSRATGGSFMSPSSDWP